VTKLVVHLRLEAPRRPRRDVQLSKISNYLTEKIQEKFPEFDIEVGDVIADWPDSEKDFINYIADCGSSRRT
jgi:hypothetical protein